MSGTYTLNGGWELMQDVHELGGGGFTEITTEEAAKYLGVTRPEASSLIYDLRMRGVLDSGSPLNSRRKVTKLRLTPLGMKILDTYLHKGEDQAEALIPSRAPVSRLAKPQPKMPASDRAMALKEARELLGPDASVDDLLRVAEFVAG